MRTEGDKGLVDVSGSLGKSEGQMPLGRIGSGLAHIYRDVVTAPLPPDLQRLVQRLEAEAEGSSRDVRSPGE